MQYALLKKQSLLINNLIFLMSIAVSAQMRAVVERLEARMGRNNPQVGREEGGRGSQGENCIQ